MDSDAKCQSSGNVVPKTDTKKAFYAVPSNAKSTMSSEIVSEARRSAVRPLDTARPFTPKTDQRRLFGNAVRNCRPPSALLLTDQVGYESYVDGRMSSPRSPCLKRLEPLPVSPRILNEDRLSRKISSAPVRLPSVTQRNVETGNLAIIDFCIRTGRVAELQNRSMSLQESDSRLYRRQLKSKLHPSYNNFSSVLDFSSSEHLSKKSSKVDAKITPLLEILAAEIIGSSESEESRLVLIVRQLYELLMEERLLGKAFQQRTPILKATFRHLDSKNVVLLLEIVRLCLMLNVSGKNLITVSKVIFKITRHDGNDQLFLENNLLELLLAMVANASPLVDTEALIYGVGSIKFLTINAPLLREISRLNGVLVLANHLREINEQKKSSGCISEQTAHVLFQLTGCLRNLAENSGNRHAFVKSGVIGELCRILEFFGDDYDIVMNVARILSKLTMYYEVCSAVTENLFCFPAAICLLEEYKHKPDLIVRLCFAFGNVTAKNEDARVLLFRHPKCLDVLLELIQLNLEREARRRRSSSSSSSRHNELREFTVSTPMAESQAKSRQLSVSDDVVIKAIRLLANLSVSTEVGRRIANDNLCLTLLLNILSTKSVESHEEMVLSAAGALSNLSYYSAGNGISPALRPEDLVECLVRLLGLDNLEALVECLRILGNVSRDTQIRRLLVINNVLESAINLLASENKDVVYLSCGLLMNLMVDKANRDAMKRQNGVETLIAVLKTLGPGKDWQLATVVCQTLWNYSCVEGFELKIANELLDVLQTYLDENKALSITHFDMDSGNGRQIARDIWLLEFCPVAGRLAQRVQWQTFPPTKTTNI